MQPVRGIMNRKHSYWTLQTHHILNYKPHGFHIPTAYVEPANKLTMLVHFIYRFLEVREGKQ